MRPFLLLSLSLAPLFAQAPPTFEVAAIKPGTRAHTKVDDSQVDLGGVSLGAMIKRAYRLQSFQIAGPDWLYTTRFDILAKLPDGATVRDVPEMLQAMLAERFHMAVHQDTKELSVYALVVDKEGPKLTTKPADWNPSAQPWMQAMTLGKLAEILSEGAERPVVDTTGIAGEFLEDLRPRPVVDMTRYAALRDYGIVRKPDAETGSASDLNDLLRPQGLRLEARKMPLTVLVIDHIDRTPTDN